MNSTSSNRRAAASIRLIGGIAAAGLLLPILLSAAAPSWWSTRNVVDTTGTATSGTNDYAAVNQGQVKNIAVKAVAELNQNFAQFGGSSAVLIQLEVILSGTTPSTNDYATVNLGQLKTLVQPFYDVLLAGGYQLHPLESGSYPWLSGSANDYAMANIGQVKNLFSFDVTYCSDGSGLPDWWRQLYNIPPNTSGTSMAPRGDMSFFQSFQQGVSPVDYYNGQTPNLTIASGNNQTGYAYEFTPLPLVVNISDYNGNPLSNAPVTFSIDWSGMLALDGSGASGTSGTVIARTDSNGNAQAWYLEPGSYGYSTNIYATAENTQVQFNSTVYTLVGDWINANKANPNYTGTTVFDSSGYGNNGILRGNVNYITSFDGTEALQLNGQGGHVEIPDAASLDDIQCNGPLTVMAWVRLAPGAILATDSNAYTVLYKGTDNGLGVRIAVQGGSAKGLIAEIDEDSSYGFWTQSVAARKDVTGVLTDGNWHHIAYVAGNSGYQDLYLDGTSVGVTYAMDMNQVPFPQIARVKSSGNTEGVLDPWIGRGPHGEFFKGAIDHVSMNYIQAEDADVLAAFNQDTDNTGMPDWWQYKYFGSIGQSGSAQSPNGDGYTILQSYQLGIPPNAQFTLQITGGNNQVCPPGSVTGNPLAVNLTDANTGNPLANATVTFTVTQGGGMLATDSGGTTATAAPVEVTTDSNGNAQIYYQEPGGSEASSIEVNAGNASPVSFATFTTTVMGDWNFDNVSGTTASDSSGYGNNGTLNGNVTQVASFDGTGALQFDGQSGFVQVPDSLSLELGPGPITMMAWVRLANGAALGMTPFNICFKDAGNGTGIQLALEGGISNGLTARIFSGSRMSQVVSAVNQQATLTDGNWHHIAFVRDQSGNAAVYLDGQVSGTQSGMGASVNSTLPFLIGCGAASGSFSGYFNGAIDDVIVERAAISSADVAAAYNQDTDNTGMPDWWQYFYFGSIGLSGSALAPSGNGLTILQSYHDGVSPTDYYNWQAPMLAIVSGSIQIGTSGAFLDNPLVVNVANATTGAPCVNAPVTFFVSSGNGGLAATGSNGITVSATMQVLTDSYGNAQVYYQEPAGALVSAQIEATAGIATPVQFLAYGGSILGEWKFNEGSGLTAYDSSPLGNNGTLGGSTEWVTSFDGSGALQFDGVGGVQGGFVEVLPNPTLKLETGPVTITAWVRLSSGASLTESDVYDVMYMEGAFEEEVGFEFALQGGASNGLVATIFTAPFLTSGSGDLFRSNESNVSNLAQVAASSDQTAILTDGNWHYVAFVRDGSGNATLYLDGNVVGTQTGMNYPIDSTSSLMMGMGEYGGYSNYISYGSFAMENVSLERVALSGTAITAAYNQDTFNTGMPDWWQNKYFGRIDLSGSVSSPSGNGLTILQSYRDGVSPTDYYNGVAPVLTPISGTNQFGTGGAFLASPLVVNVVNSATGAPYFNAPVTFSVSPGNGGFAATNGKGATVSATLQALTDADGNAEVYYQEPPANIGITQIMASAGIATPVQFTAYNGPNVGEWEFDEWIGTTAYDSSPFGNTGTLAGTTAWITSFDGSGALQFDGQSGFVQVPDNISLTLGTGPATFSAWVRLASGAPLEADTDVYDVVYKGTASGSGFELALEGGSSNGLVARIFNGTTPQQIVPATDESSLLADGNWHYVAFVEDGSGNATLYLDGNVVGAQTGMNASVDSTQPLWIGKGASGGYFNGAIDNVSLERVALSGSAIAAAYNQDTDGSGMPDWWQYKYFGSIGQDAKAQSPDGDGYTLLKAYQNGMVPVDYYNGQSLTLTIVSGNNQTGLPGYLLFNPLVVQVTDSANGTALANAPVSFTVGNTGGGLLALNAGISTPASSLSVTTNGYGMASVDFTLPQGFGVNASVTAQATNGSQSVQQTFAASTASLPTAVLWLKADSLSGTTGTPIADWPDQSGLNNDATQQNNGNQPTLNTNALNGLPTVHFNENSGQYFYLPNVMGSAIAGEMFVLVQTTYNNQYLIDFGSTDEGDAYPSYDNQIYEDFGSSVQYCVGTPFQPLSQFNIYNVSAQNGLWAARINGLRQFISKTNTVSFGTSGMIGRHIGSGSYNFNGDIAEIVVYDRVLSANERTTVENYLGRKYALVGPPPAPTNLTCQALCGSQVVLTWSGTVGGFSTQFLIERKTGNNAYTQIAIIKNLTSYIDTSASAGIAYSYRVQEMNAAGDSLYSNEAAIIPTSSSVAIPVGSLALWLRADLGVTTDAYGNVCSWVDQSGNNNTATQQNTAYCPQLTSSGTNGFNGRPTLHFDGSNGGTYGSELTIPNPVITGTCHFTWVYVAKWNSTAVSDGPNEYQYLMSQGESVNAGGTNSYFVGCFGGPDYGNQLSASWGDDVGGVSGPPIAANKTLLGVTTYDGTSHRMWINGIFQGSAPQADSNLSAVGRTTIGSYLDYTCCSDVDIAEIMVFNCELSTDEISQLGVYLNQKYGLVAAPPSPTGLGAEAISGSEVNLYWNAPLGSSDTRFSIQRATASGSFTQIALVDQGTSFIDACTLPGSTYAYQVQSINYSGTSDASNTASVTTPGFATGIPVDALALWLKADTGVNTDGSGNVYSWADQSGNNNMAIQIVPGSMPQLTCSGSNGFNGRPALHFNNAYLTIPNLVVTGTNHFTWVYVAKWNSATTSYSTSGNLVVGAQCLMSQGVDSPNNAGLSVGIFGGTAGTVPYGASSLEPGMSLSTCWNNWGTWQWAGGVVNGPPIFTGTALMAVSVYDGVSHQMWVNGVLQGSTPETDSNFSNGGNTIIGNDMDFSMPAYADIAEIMVFNRELNATEMSALNQYLAVKYLLPDFDANGDGLTTAQDLALGLNPLGNPDANGDGLTNAENLELGINPTSPYLNWDGLIDSKYTFAQKIALEVDPFLPYTPPTPPPDDPDIPFTLVLLTPPDAVLLP